MNRKTKVIIISSFVGALVYTGIMFLVENADKEHFSIWRILLYFVSFGVIQGLVTSYNLKKLKQNDQSE